MRSSSRRESHPPAPSVPARTSRFTARSSWSPPQLSRWRLVLPKEAVAGPTPHKWANAASLCRQSIFRPALTTDGWLARDLLRQERGYAGATCPNNAQRCSSRATISASTSRTRVARLRSANLDAWTGSSSRSVLARSFWLCSACQAARNHKQVTAVRAEFSHVGSVQYFAHFEAGRCKHRPQLISQI
jgi:hypothetical protein